ncbi:uncharacterized protein LOC116108181 [Pistacia vera]|uniref:uncharacterized protein LOC116108181 n=1 Tax=Pistacia vera TaxID=55513 RepID=UPI001262E635|nr:uncharacterized protein LOC116108181 [Pistacia vera]
MLTVIAKCQYAAEIWITLGKEFLTKSRAKTLHVKSLLQNAKKDGLSMHHYFLKIKGFAKILSASGVSVTDEELLNYILDGLDSDYDAAVVNITFKLESRLKPIPIQEAQIILPRLEKANFALNSVVHNEFHGVSANVASLAIDTSNKKPQLLQDAQNLVGKTQYNTLPQPNQPHHSFTLPYALPTQN